MLWMLLLTGCLIWAPPREEDTGEPVCDNYVVATQPMDGEELAYFRAPVEVWFDEVDQSAVLELRAHGEPVQGVSHWQEELLVFEPDLPLEPLSDYTLDIHFECGDPTLHFATSSAGLPVDEELQQGVWMVDLYGARWRVGQDLGSILQVYMDARGLVLEVGDEGVHGLSVESRSAPPPFEACVGGFDQRDLSWEGPSFTVQGPFELGLGGMLLHLDGLTGTVTPPGELEGVSLWGQLDTRYMFPDEGPQAACEHIESLQETCEACPDGLLYCLPFTVDLAGGARLDEAESLQGTEDTDADGFPTCANDCAPDDPAIHPGAEELCNGLDDDCDGIRDEGMGQVWCYQDADGDGWGVDDTRVRVCVCAEGWVQLKGDCDDQHAEAHPGGTEVCDGLDNDCDGVADDPVLGDEPECSAVSCRELHRWRDHLPDGEYWIDAGLGPPVLALCDMSTNGGGWTAVPYASDLSPAQRHAGGASWRWLGVDLELAWDEALVAELQAHSTEGFQRYVATCDGVVHYFDQSTSSFDRAAGFRFLDGTETAHGASSWSPHDITVALDECSAGGQGQTVFEINSPLVPVVNIELNDGGDEGDLIGAELLTEPAWLR